MTNKDNVEAIIEKMLDALQDAPTDSRIRRDLVKKIYQSVEKYSPSKTWFVKTMNKLFKMAADLITLDISNKFINVICEHEAESDNKKFRDSIIKIYKGLLKKSYHMPDSHMQVIVYILGEYVPQIESSEKATEVLDLLCDSCGRSFEKLNTIGWTITAISKIHMSLDYEPNENVNKIINKFKKSKETHLQQRCNEYLEAKLLYQGGDSRVKECMFTPYNEFKNTSFDFDLDFLDNYVEESVAGGARTLDDDKRKEAITLTGTQDHSIEKELNFTPYERPTRGAMTISTQPRVEKTKLVSDKPSTAPRLNVNSGAKKGRWTKAGFVNPDEEKKIETKNNTFKKRDDSKTEEPVEDSKTTSVSLPNTKKSETK